MTTWLSSFLFIVDLFGERDLVDRELLAGDPDHASGGAGAQGGAEDSGVAGRRDVGSLLRRTW